MLFHLRSSANERHQLSQHEHDMFFQHFREYFVMSEPKWPPGGDESQLGCTAAIGPIWLQDRYQSLWGRMVHFQPGWHAAADMSFVSETLERKLCCGRRLASVTAPIRADVPRGENNGWKRRVFFTAVIPTAIHHKDKIPFPPLVKKGESENRRSERSCSGPNMSFWLRLSLCETALWQQRDSPSQPQQQKSSNDKSNKTKQLAFICHLRQQCYMISRVFS